MIGALRVKIKIIPSTFTSIPFSAILENASSSWSRYTVWSDTEKLSISDVVSDLFWNPWNFSSAITARFVGLPNCSLYSTASSLDPPRKPITVLLLSPVKEINKQIQRICVPATYCLFKYMSRDM